MKAYSSNRHKKTLAFFVLLTLLLSALSLLVYVQIKLSNAPLPLGKTIPTFKLSTFKGDSVSLSEYYGKKCILLFFTSKCRHCKNALLTLEQFYQKYNLSIEILSISFSDEITTKELVAKYNFSFPVFLDTGGEARRVCGITGVPTLLLLDEYQILCYRLWGDHPIEVEERLIKEFISNKFSVAKNF
jgi:peroxiredoxin